MARNRVPSPVSGRDRVSGVIGQIKVRRNSLFPAEGRVADIVVASPEQVLYLPIAELAARAEVSEGTVIRFCQTIGLSGYPALKLALAVDLSRPTLAIYRDIEPKDAANLRTVVEKVFRSDMQSLEDTLGVASESALRHTTEALLSARRVAFFAVGTSQPVAFDAYSRLLRIGVPVHLDFDAHIQVMTASLLKPGDLALAISHSGASREPVECLALAKANGATTVAITGRHPSPLTEYADEVLLTVSSETAYREEAMASRIAQLSLIDTLYVAVGLRRPERALNALRTTSAALASHRVSAKRPRTSARRGQKTVLD